VSRWVYLVLTVLAIVAVVYIYFHRLQLGLVGAPNPTTTQTENAVATGPEMYPARVVWQNVDRTPDGFQLQMPEDEREVQVPAYTDRGTIEQVDMLLSSPDGQATYSVAWADDPPVVRAESPSVERTLDAARAGALKRTQTSLISESNTRVQGFPACDFTGRNAEGGLLDARLVLAGKRLYMLVAAFPSAQASSQQNVSQFFGDFRLTASASIPKTVPLAPASGQ